MQWNQYLLVAISILTIRFSLGFILIFLQSSNECIIRNGRCTSCGNWLCASMKSEQMISQLDHKETIYCVPATVVELDEDISENLLLRDLVKALKATDMIFINVLVESSAEWDISPDTSNPLVNAALNLNKYMRSLRRGNYMSTYGSKNKCKSRDGEWTELRCMNNTLVLLVAEPHHIHNLL